MHKNDLIGIWKLIYFKMFLQKNEIVIHPYGENPSGFLVYTQDDYMSVHIMCSHRNPCESSNYSSISYDEKIEIAENYGGYFGRYEICNNTVVHYPEISSFPNFINTPLTRQFQLHGDELILEHLSPGKGNAEKIHSQLAWQRLKFSNTTA
jgi:Lipocalin-like domain